MNTNNSKKTIAVEVAESGTPFYICALSIPLWWVNSRGVAAVEKKRWALVPSSGSRTMMVGNLLCICYKNDEVGIHD